MTGENVSKIGAPCRNPYSKILAITIFAICYSSHMYGVEGFSNQLPSKATLRFPISGMNSNHRMERYDTFRNTHFNPHTLQAQATIELEEPKSLVNDFTPETMSLRQSMVFFVKYLFKHQKELTLKRQIMYPNSLRSKLFPSRYTMDDISKADAKILRKEIKREQQEKKPFWETMRSLNESRKELIELVGYDSKLLVSCFGFAMLAAFMNSVIPHYYGQSVNCLANALTTSRTEVIKALTGLGVASVLCALFTGIRGALFWLAGTSCLSYIIKAFLISHFLPLFPNRFSWKLQYQSETSQEFAASRGRIL